MRWLGTMSRSKILDADIREDGRKEVTRKVLVSWISSLDTRCQALT